MSPYKTFFAFTCFLLVGLVLPWFAVVSEASTPVPEDAALEDESLTADGRLAEPDSYQLNAGDLIHIIVHQEPDLERELRVSQNGSVQLPLLGTVEIAGLTVQEATERVRDLYDANYLVNPQINLIVKEYSQRRVNVMGEVNRPGTVNFPPEESMTIIDAISLAGGPNSVANMRSVRLIRKNEEGEIQHFTINVDEIMGGNSDVLWVLQKDDTINVPRRRF